MRVNRRRSRQLDPLANPDAVKLVFDHLREKLPGLVPDTQGQVIQLLNAVRNIERRSVTDTRRGRPSRWKRQDLLKVASQLRAVLVRETNGRISVNSFVGIYVPLLEFPDDILRPLVTGEITLFEASQLARVRGCTLGKEDAEAIMQRTELLKTHLITMGSQASLRARVDERLGYSVRKVVDSNPERNSAMEIVDDLVEIDPYDSRHLFWEELRRIGAALRNIGADDVDEPTLEEFLSIMDRLSAILERIEKRRTHGENQKSRVLRFRV